MYGQWAARGIDRRRVAGTSAGCGAALENVDRFKSPTATGGSEDMIDREFDNRTSLIVDPPDGKIPPLTPEGRRRQAAAATAGVRPDPADPEDLSNPRRCLTFG